MCVRVGYGVCAYVHQSVTQVPILHVPILHVPIFHVPILHVPILHVPILHVPILHALPVALSVEKMQGWGFVYSLSLLHHSYMYLV